jgi:(1->4)-alpha-D-glucan 1-alpha-D-glucosylmutase
MLATATHDHKRGEDVRARLYLLSEISGQWEDAVRRWSSHNKALKTTGAPDANLEYLLYQVLVGAYPLPLSRALAYALKAAREAKVNTSWLHPDPGFELALRGFVGGILADQVFVADLEAFVAPLLAPGWRTSLAQKLICLTAPGVPDVYQGTELWDLSLVDPDNRSPVDFELRAQLAGEIDTVGPEQAWERAAEGLPKLLVVARALRLRQRRPDLLAPGARYEALSVTGPKERHLVAFARAGGAVTLAPRLLIGLGDAWGETSVNLPPGRWRDEFTGEVWEGGQQALSGLLARFPVGLLVRQ